MSVSWNPKDEDVLPLHILLVHAAVSLCCWAFIVGMGYLGYHISQHI